MTLYIQTPESPLPKENWLKLPQCFLRRFVNVLNVFSAAVLATHAEGWVLESQLGQTKSLKQVMTSPPLHTRQSTGVSVKGLWR